MRVALVHDWILNIGGAERVLKELHFIFPEAPIYVLFHNQKFTGNFLPKAKIISSSLQKVPFITSKYKYLQPLMPLSVESWDLSDFDLVISSSNLFAHGLVLRPQTKHICYCYSPARILWDRNFAQKNLGFSRKLIKHLWRIWDRNASDRVDQYTAISEHVKKRVEKYYRRDAKVIYPPLTAISEQQPASSKNESYRLSHIADYYLIVSRLYKYKNIHIAIQAFNKLGHKLVILGKGPYEKRLKRLAGKNIIFKGALDDEELAEYYKNCRAFIMPQEEDFGLTALEAMSFGKPVLALRKGGALEIVAEGITGEFFDDAFPEGLADCVRRFNENYTKYDPEVIKSKTKKFSRENFRREILDLIK